MSMKLKKTLALVLSLATVFSAAFTSMAEIPVGAEEPVEVIEVGNDEVIVQEAAESAMLEVEEVVEEIGTEEINPEVENGTADEKSVPLLSEGEIRTVADIFNTVKNFPTTESETLKDPPATALRRSIYASFVLFLWKQPSNITQIAWINLNDEGQNGHVEGDLSSFPVTQSGNDYVSRHGASSITYHMEDGKLVALTLNQIVPSVNGTWSTTGSLYLVNSLPESDKSTKHGYLTFDRVTAEPNATVSITVVPEKGYQLKNGTITVEGSFPGGELNPKYAQPDPNDRTKYTFTMPGYCVKISAQFEKLPEITAWEQLQEIINAAGTKPTTITLTQDLTAESTDEAISIGANQNITLDLNGFTLDRGFSGKEAAGNGEVIYIENGGKLTLTDSSDAKTGTVTGGNNKSGTPPTNGYGGGVHNAGTFIMEDGTISGNAAYLGGGVFSSGEFTMQGGNISENVSNGNGGGIYIQSGKSFVMTDGKICGNTSNRGGGGIFLEAETSFFMKGGEITGNKAENGNKLGFPGGGVLFQSDSGEMHVGGTAVIKNNKGSKDGTESESNVSTYGSALLIGTGSDVPRPAEGMLISVELVEKIENAVAGDEKYFTADDPECEVVYNSAGYLELKKFTIADILPSDFPTSVENAWVHETAKDKIAYKNSSEYLYVGGDMVLLATNVTASGDDYVCTYEKYGKDGIITNKLTFHMVDGELQSITLESPSVTESAGTYKPAAVTEISVPAGLAGVKYTVKDVTDPENPETLIPKAGTMAGASAYEVKIGAKIEITAIPAEGYEVTGTNPYVIEKVTTETVVKPEDLPSVQSKQQGSKITFSAGSGVKSVTVYSKMTGGTQTFTSDQFPVTLPIPAGEEIIIKSVECESGYTCDLTLPYTYIVPDHDDTFTITAGRSSDPKEEREPLYTGTWNAPVKSGSWSQDAHGIWHYSSSETFRNTWGYIVNPYAKEGQHPADWFWFDRQGNMLTGWQFINGKWYYLNPTKDGTLGACLLGPGKTPDGYEIDASGAWTGR